jgi:hypothetical protein
MMPVKTLLLWFAFAPYAHAEPTWSQISQVTQWDAVTTKKHKEGGTIQVFSKTIAEIPCYRAIAQSTASPQIMMEVAMDIVGSLKWSTAGLTRSEILNRQGNQLDYIQYIDVPAWTFSSDRFWILRGVKTENGKSLLFTWKRLGENGGPYAKEYQQVKDTTSAIEPPVNVGGWEFVPDGANTKVKYTICTDSGGSVPRSIQNMATKTTLPDTVGDLIRESVKRTK